MTKRVLMPIAQGTEDMEAVITLDMLRRASIRVVLVSDNNIVTCSKGTKIIPDKLYKDLEPEDEYDAVVIPGGLQGTQHLINNEDFKKILIEHHAKGKLIAAICAAPTILSEFKILQADTAVTSHLSVKERLKQHVYREENVVLHNNILTARAAGNAFAFSLRIIDLLVSEEVSVRIANDILFNYKHS